MARITRYVMLELLKIFIFTLAGMTGLMLLSGLLKEAMQKGLSIGPIIRIVPYVLPDALRFAVPATILFAVSSVYGRMAATNEIVALKSLGISPVTVLIPAWILGFGVSLTAVWLNDVAVSWGRQGVHRIVLESVEQIVYGMLKTQTSYTTRHFSMNVKQVRGQVLERVTMTLHSGKNEPIVITAAEAELKANPAQNTLRILMRNGTVDYGEDAAMEFPDELPYDIPLSSASRKGVESNRPSECPLYMIPHNIRKQRENILAIEQSMAAEAGFQLISGSFGALEADRWEMESGRLEGARSRLYRLQTEPCRRWANGFSCFFFVFVGAPLAIRMKNSDLWTSFATCFLPILVIYYPLLALSVDRAKDGSLPPYSVWLGNLILALLGIWMTRRAVRY